MSAVSESLMPTTSTDTQSYFFLFGLDCISYFGLSWTNEEALLLTSVFNSDLKGGDPCFTPGQDKLSNTHHCMYYIFNCFLVHGKQKTKL